MVLQGGGYRCILGYSVCILGVSSRVSVDPPSRNTMYSRVFCLYSVCVPPAVFRCVSGVARRAQAWLASADQKQQRSKSGRFGCLFVGLGPDKSVGPRQARHLLSVPGFRSFAATCRSEPAESRGEAVGSHSRLCRDSVFGVVASEWVVGATLLCSGALAVFFGIGLPMRMGDGAGELTMAACSAQFDHYGASFALTLVPTCSNRPRLAESRYRIRSIECWCFAICLGQPLLCRGAPAARK